MFFREDTCYLGSSFGTACYLLVVLRLWSSGFGCKCHVTNHSDIYLHIHTRSYIIWSKVGECYVFLLYLISVFEVSSVHQGRIYLIHNSVNIEILLQLK